MTGPEHYREAERLREVADEVGKNMQVDQQRNLILAAQVHATLALAAATIVKDSQRVILSELQGQGWREAIL